ncbi:MAG: protein translocase subunit SecD [Nitrospinota bacterium]
MYRNLKWKFALILIVIGLMIWLAYPLDEKINLGLDLKGGIHLVLEVETEKAVETIAERYAANTKNALKKKDIDFQSVQRDKDNSIIIELLEARDLTPLEDIMNDYPYLERRDFEKNGLRLIYSLSDEKVKNIKDNAVDQALETIRNRVDQFGVAEPTIQREGTRRIIVELPGIRDPERAINLIGSTALLEFKLVDEERSVEEALKGDIPEGDEILYEKDRKTGKDIIPYLLKKQAVLTGDSLTLAEVRIDREYNEPYVGIGFDREGARIFRQITGENVGKRLAIVLDNNVYSAPVIREKISGGEAQITGNFTSEEAHDLAIVLRAGALPAPVTILENRTVGPSLGHDSIKNGITSILIGGIIVIAFMIIYYKLSGFVANIALFLNLIIIFGVLAYFKAALTLPGIAGLILTVGMAVDANVLIFERIREELRIGKTVRAAIEAGFAKAFWTIIDANVTTIIAAIVLFQFGTGPIRGFATTLAIGIMASMFTALFVSRVIFDFVLSRKKIDRLSI